MEAGVRNRRLASLPYSVLKRPHLLLTLLTPPSFLHRDTSTKKTCSPPSYPKLQKGQDQLCTQRVPGRAGGFFYSLFLSTPSDPSCPSTPELGKLCRKNTSGCSHIYTVPTPDTWVRQRKDPPESPTHRTTTLRRQSEIIITKQPCSVATLVYEAALPHN